MAESPLQESGRNAHGVVKLDGWTIDTDLVRHEFDGSDQWSLSVRVNGTFVGSWIVSGRSSISSVDPPRVTAMGETYPVDGPDDPPRGQPRCSDCKEPMSWCRCVAEPRDD